MGAAHFLQFRNMANAVNIAKLDFAQQICEHLNLLVSIALT